VAEPTRDQEDPPVHRQAAGEARLTDGEAFLVAAVQAAPIFLDRDATVEKGVALIEEAGAHGAKVIAFPETWIPGYPAWIFGAADWDEPLSKRVFARLQRNAVTVPSAATEALCRAARRAGAYVVMGINERDGTYSRGTIFNSQLTISSDGEIVGVHRKIMPTHAERIIWGYGDGSTLHVHETPFGRIGSLICWEHWMPLARFAMHAKAEQVHIAAWPEVPDIHHLASRHYAFEGRCYVICVGSYMTTEHLPEDFELPAAMGAAGDFGGSASEILPGGSGIIGPDGAWIAGPVSGREEIVYGEVDLGRIAEEHQALDVVGHYNRPDIFQLTVDERPRYPVSWLTAPPAAGGIAQVEGKASRGEAVATRRGA
jgi:nitrilase